MDNVQSKKGKVFYLSKTFWVNVLAIVALVVQYFTGWVMSAGLQATVLGILNILLRLVTKHPINWVKQPAATVKTEKKQTLPGIMIAIVLPVILLSTGIIGCASLHDAAIRKPISLITCEYYKYIGHDPTLSEQSKKIREHTADLLRAEVKAPPCAPFGGDK